MSLPSAASRPARSLNPIYAELPTTIFEVMSQLARTHEAVNLGQGFPDDPGPEDVRRTAADAVVNGWNQYPPMMGLPELRAAAATHYRRWQGLELDPDAEVMVTSGATEALAGALLALIESGDEVVLFQPLYDAYLPLVKRAGGIPKLVRLEPPSWSITREALAAAFSERTKLVLFNNPQNPTGVVYGHAELALLAEFCVAFDAYAVSDEVWEHVIFDGVAFTSLMALPGMRERTVKISSAGKIFGMTGWKVGLVFAAPPLMKVLSKAHQFLTFTTPPNLQVAVAYGLGKADDYFTGMRADLQRSRDRLAQGLASLGFSVLPSAGTYFLSIDLAAHTNGADDEAFCLDLVRTFGVATIPVSAFYAQDAVKSVVRFCFAKRDETIDRALERLAKVTLRR
ncbi:UNVERIFIED_ORG: aspartate/methionine/tyrosine aminotransferase [Xanthobacter viscosus]|jgi:aspartate/methionine/tyrosine aminotransferase|uniref:aspartate transaminase n=1 Tax=Xanthobacter autotrophicus TaxID=280 RepID=A0A6C1KSZ2_XANAU|nr:aminotransferase [Xanthobacter autotrophicus]TLX43476.1 aminotransferase [Xanthobacter autotrophicus]